MSVNQHYADVVSEILQHQGDVAAAAQQKSGQIWGGALSDIGKTVGDVVPKYVDAQHDEQITAIFKKYGTDYGKAIPEVMGIDPKRGAALAAQWSEVQKNGYDMQLKRWQLANETQTFMANQLASVQPGPQAQQLWTKAILTIQHAGLPIEDIDQHYSPEAAAQYLRSIQTAAERIAASKPTPPEISKPGDIGRDPHDPTKVLFTNPAAPPAQPAVGSPGSVLEARTQENMGTPAPAPTAAPAPAQTWQPPTTPIAPRGAGPSAGGPSAPPEPDRSTWEKRADGSDKGNGFLGLQKRTDGKVSSEISITTSDVEPGKDVEIPTMVPTLTPQETQWLLSHDISNPKTLPQAITEKAVDFARSRRAAGLPYFATPAESPTTAAPAPTAPKMSRNQAIILADEQEKAAAAKATSDAKGDTHSPIYKEWQDYQAQGGKLGFEPYMKADANRHVPASKVEVHLNSEGGIGTLDKEGLDFAATTYRVAGRLPARDKDQNGAIISAAAHQGKELGQTPAVMMQKQASFKSDSGSLALMTKMSDASQASEAKALGQVELIRELSAKVPRTQFPLINSAIQAGKIDLLGDSNAKQLANALITFTSEYGKIIEGSVASVAGSSDSSRKASDRLIGAELSKGTMNDVLNLMGREMRLTNMGYDAAIGHITDRLQGGTPTPGAIRITPPPPAASTAPNPFRKK